jgi:hypothetical protein
MDNEERQRQITEAIEAEEAEEAELEIEES